MATNLQNRHKNNQKKQTSCASGVIKASDFTRVGAGSETFSLFRIPDNAIVTNVYVEIQSQFTLTAAGDTAVIDKIGYINSSGAITDANALYSTNIDLESAVDTFTGVTATELTAAAKQELVRTGMGKNFGVEIDTTGSLPSEGRVRVTVEFIEPEVSMNMYMDFNPQTDN